MESYVRGTIETKSFDTKVATEVESEQIETLNNERNRFREELVALRTQQQGIRDQHNELSSRPNLTGRHKTRITELSRQLSLITRQILKTEQSLEGLEEKIRRKTTPVASRITYQAPKRAAPTPKSSSARPRPSKGTYKCFALPDRKTLLKAQTSIDFNLNYLTSEEEEETGIQLAEEIHIDTDDDDNIEYVEIDDNYLDSFDEAAELLPPHELPGGFFVPGRLWEMLFDYQQTGISWLISCHPLERGCILGDQQGLGKTVQLIAFLATLYCSGQLGPTLLVVPASLIAQWIKEIRRYWPAFKVRVMHGSYGVTSQESKIKVLSEMEKQEAHILLITYTGVLKNIDLLNMVPFQYIILDEGHRIKNPASQISKAMSQFKTPHRVCLTGSPIQNDLVELFSLVDWVVPGFLGSLELFKRNFAKPIKQACYSSATLQQMHTGQKCAEALRLMIDQVMLRRLKSTIEAKLPPKTENIVFLALTPFQLDLYHEYINSDEVQDIVSSASSNAVKLVKKDNNMVHTVLVRLQQLCNHGDIFQQRMNQNGDIETYGTREHSSKMQYLAEKLVEWTADPTNKILLYTQTVMFLDIIEAMVANLGITYLRFDGSTPILQRRKIVNSFQQNPDIRVFMVTTRSGGEGLNLVAANKLIIVDPNWNGQVDRQALERCWRIGQTRPVEIIRLSTLGTLEEKILRRQVFKELMSASVLTTTQTEGVFSEKDLHSLLILEPSAYQQDDPRRPETKSKRVNNYFEPRVETITEQPPDDAIETALTMQFNVVVDKDTRRESNEFVNRAITQLHTWQNNNPTIYDGSNNISYEPVDDDEEEGASIISSFAPQAEPEKLPDTADDVVVWALLASDLSRYLATPRTSADVVNEFKHRFKDEKEKFRTLLMKLAKFNNLDSTWSLK